MASIFDSLYPGSWNGVSFLIEDSSVAGGRKAVVHEFPNSGRYVEDLGLLNETITLNVCIPSAEYFGGRDAVKQALEEKGYGTLIHPFYGIRKAVCTGYTINEAVTELGYVKISMTLSVGQELSFPATGQASSSGILSAVEGLMNMAGMFLTTSFIFRSIYGRLGASVAQAISDIFPVFGRASTTYLYRSGFNSEETAEYRAAYDLYTQNTYKYLFNAQDFHTDTVDLLDKFDLLTSSGRDGFDAANKLLTYDFSQPNKPAKTEKQASVNILRLTVKFYIKSLVYGICCRNASIYSFESLEEYNHVRQTLETEYRSVVDIYSAIVHEGDAFRSISVDATGTGTSFMNSLEGVHTKTLNFLEQASSFLPSLEQVDGRNLPVTVLAYTYYGTLDNVEQLTRLNFPQRIDPSCLDGTVSILSVTPE